MQCVLLGDWPVIRFPRRASRSGQEFGQFRGSPPLLAVVSQQPGFVEPARSVADRLGLVRILLVTHEGHAVVGDAEGVRTGPTFDELAEALRSNLSAGTCLLYTSDAADE